MNSKCNPNRYYGRQPGQYVHCTVLTKVSMFLVNSENISLPT